MKNKYKYCHVNKMLKLYSSFILSTNKPLKFKTYPVVYFNYIISYKVFY